MNSLLILAIDLSVKATALLTVAVLVNVFLGKRQAAVRHRILCLSFCGLLGLPLLSAVLPSWNLPLVPEIFAALDSKAEIATDQNRQLRHWPRY